MKVIFLRHGIAADREAWSGDDGGRPLTPDGIERMKRQARRLAEFLPEIKTIVTSPLVRARETAEILAKELKSKNPLVEDERVIDLSARTLAHILETHHDAETIVLVGHEPTMSETISELIGGGSIELKKAAIACVELPDRYVMRGELIWLIPPKMLLL